MPAQEELYRYAYQKLVLLLLPWTWFIVLLEIKNDFAFSDDQHGWYSAFKVNACDQGNSVRKYGIDTFKDTVCQDGWPFKLSAVDGLTAGLGKQKSRHQLLRISSRFV